MRLDKYLADMGLGTRSELKKGIRKGKALVKGVPVKDPGFLVSADSDVEYDGIPVSYESHIYYMLNKPAGVISATEDAGRQTTVLDLIDDRKRKDLFPVGRLDKDTEGLLLITNDGPLAHRLLSPKHHVDKVYAALVTGSLTERDIMSFAKGLQVDEDFLALPAKVRSLGQDDPIWKEGKGAARNFIESKKAGIPSFEAFCAVEITIQEGKFHQIKRMFHAIGKEVLYLKRLSMGPLRLDPDLQPGQYRRLTDEEIDALLFPPNSACF